MEFAWAAFFTPVNRILYDLYAVLLLTLTIGPTVLRKSSSSPFGSVPGSAKLPESINIQFSAVPVV